MAERHARDFERLLAEVESAESVETGARLPEEPGEIEALHQFVPGSRVRADSHSPSGMSDDELMKALQEDGWNA